VPLERYTYTPYGAVTRYAGNWGEHTTDYQNPYLYTGRRLDAETGLYYYFARYYHAQLGRFINRDPIAYAGGDANLYRYVRNSPTNATDPSGLEIKNWQMWKQYRAMYPDDPVVKAFQAAGGTFKTDDVGYLIIAVPDHEHVWVDDDPYRDEDYYQIRIETDLPSAIQAALLLRQELLTVLTKWKAMQGALYDCMGPEGAHEAAYYVKQGHIALIQSVAEKLAIYKEVFDVVMSVWNDGYDIVITLSELSDGNISAALAALPLIPAAATKGGRVVIKHADRIISIPRVGNLDLTLSGVANFMSRNANRINEKLGDKLGKLPFQASREGFEQAREAVEKTLLNATDVSPAFINRNGDAVFDVFSKETSMTVRIRADGTFDTLIPEATSKVRP